MISRFYLCVLMCCLLLGACSKDNCDDVLCLNDGICEDGSCNCGDWYTGANCEDEFREQFYGQYLGELIFGSTVSAGSMTFFASPEGINAMTFVGDGYIELKTNGEFIIPEQNVGLGGNIVLIEGTGAFSDGEVSFNFDINSGTEIINFTYWGVLQGG